MDLSPAAAFAHAAYRAPGATSVVDEDARWTARQVAAAAAALAGELTAAGVRPGDRVAHAGRNSVELLVTLLASAHAGAVFVPLGFRLSAAEAGALLDHAEPSALLVDHDLADVYRDVAHARPGLSLVPHGHATPRALGADADAHPYGEPTRCAPDDLAVLIYTSGTSGRPKGVQLTHGNLWWSARNIDATFDTRADDVALAVAPMSHIGGLNAFVLRTLVRGGTVLSRRAFDAERSLADLVGGATTVFGVPAMFGAITRCPGFEVADLSGVRAAIVAGAPVPPALVRTFAARGMHLQQSWGMSETGPGATYLPQRWTTAKAGSAGLPLPWTTLRLADPVSGAVTPVTAGATGAAGAAATAATAAPATCVGDDDVRARSAAVVAAGEIQVRGPNVTPGYWRDPETTRAAFTDDGWLRTGDLATLDPDGCVTVVGRLSEVINTGGEKVFPCEVERAVSELATREGVDDLAVVGVPDPRWGETIVLAVEGPGPLPALDEVRALGALTLARHKLPTAVVGVATLPRKATGKVDRTALRGLAVAATTAPAATTAAGTEPVPAATAPAAPMA
ncbi:AMP-binding protein [Actinotalea sp. JY-7876]|uniref:AMP-binding protein n=3 Tax=unclassified Actinotalea TaxID=2638618 RepID=UPI001C7107D5|nr:AMP-binding protein [Actinotalea sp. JY-7876]